MDSAPEPAPSPPSPPAHSAALAALRNGPADPGVAYYRLTLDSAYDALDPAKVKGPGRGVLPGGFAYKSRQALRSRALVQRWLQVLGDPAALEPRRPDAMLSKCFLPGAAVQITGNGTALTYVICLTCNRVDIIGSGPDPTESVIHFMSQEALAKIRTLEVASAGRAEN